MAQKKNKPVTQKPENAKTQPGASVPEKPAPSAQPMHGIYNFNIQALVVGLLAVIIYANTFSHEWTLDDTLVIVSNDYVHEGVSGIPSILSKDSYDSYYRQMNITNQLAGGRYRPLSIVTFAMEQQLLGTIVPKSMDNPIPGYVSGIPRTKLVSDMHVRHVINVLLYALSGIALLYFLRRVVFKGNLLAPLVATVIFVTHPIHTEVVANVKSRDEILSLLFICLTFILAFRYHESQKKLHLGLALLSFFLAFLSKEYAIGLIVLLPLAFYCFNDFSLRQSIIATLPYLGVVVIYVIIRSQIVTPMSEDAKKDLLNTPYLLATPMQKIATQIATTLNYLRLLIFPHPLSSDYSYNSIPYKDFANPLVWLSLICHGALVYGFFYFLKRDRILSFAIAFYLLNLLLVCNVIFNIGGTMGERLIYHSSVGFCMAAGYLLYKASEKIKPVPTGNMVLACATGVIVLLCSFKTMDRNKDWKNNPTLFSHDLKVEPDNVMLNDYAAKMLIYPTDSAKVEKKNLEEGIRLVTHAVTLDTGYALAYLDRVAAYYQLHEPDSCINDLEKVKELYPANPDLPSSCEIVAVDLINKDYTNAGPGIKKEEFRKAIQLLKTSIQFNRQPVLSNYTNLAIAYYKMEDADSCIMVLDKARVLAPNNPQLSDIYYFAGYTYFSQKQVSKAAAAWQTALRMNPNNAQAKNGLMTLGGAVSK